MTEHHNQIPLIPARMVHQHVYCPRLAYLMWAQSEMAVNVDVIEGRQAHKRADEPKIDLPSAEDLQDDIGKGKYRSVTVSSEKIGVIAKIDVLETENGEVLPIEYKKSKRPHVSGSAYEPSKIQVCLQAMLLEEQGYSVSEGMIYYVGSRERVPVKLDAELRANTISAVNSMAEIVRSSKCPPPLVDSPKCPRCSLVTICMPDELHSLQHTETEPRPIAIPGDYSLPLVIQDHKASISKSGGTLLIKRESMPDNRQRLSDISELALFGNISISTPALMELMRLDIPVAFHSYGGWFHGVAHGHSSRNVEIRQAQYQCNQDKEKSLEFSRELVAAKIYNQRTILRRNWDNDTEEKAIALKQLKLAVNKAKGSSNTEELLGIEGSAASVYFRSFSSLLNPKTQDEESAPSWFSFETRNRRPPTDPVNAMLSYAYSILTRHFTTAIITVGLDPYLGLFHAARFGKPALALDLMEPFRPIVSDSVVLQVINTGEITEKDFVTTSVGTSFNERGRKTFLAALERRFTQTTTHPIFGYKLDMRRLIILQCHLLKRFFLGELDSYPHYLPR